MTPVPDVKRYAELHLHLEGTLGAETLQQLEPSLTTSEIEQRQQFTDFGGFIQTYIWVTQHLRRPEDYALATKHLLDRLHRQGIVYAEITLSAGVVLWRKQDLIATCNAIEAVCQSHAVQTAWILDAIRHFGVEHAREVAEFAALRVNRETVAFGIGGDELRGPASWFGEVYSFAKQAGLRLVAHAGETDGPASIWAALELGSERIGHGIRAIEDPVLVRHLADRSIPLEVCITSNLCTGVVNDLTRHPVRQLYDAGVPVTLNTDDPALFRTDLEKEFRLASELGLSTAALEEIRRNGFRYAFREIKEA